MVAQTQEGVHDTKQALMSDCRPGLFYGFLGKRQCFNLDAGSYRKSVEGTQK